MRSASEQILLDKIDLRIVNMYILLVRIVNIHLGSFGESVAHPPKGLGVRNHGE